MRTAGGTAFVLRNLARTVHALAELGLPPACLPSLADRNLSGLLLVCGAPKSGKTTTACAIVKERLRRHGGVAVTAEEPVELALEGSHGPGICFQTAVPDGRLGIAESLRRLARSGAQTLLVGDIRDDETAAEVLAAGVDGRLVIATMTAESILHAIVKLHGLAGRKLPADTVSALIADGLAGVLHRRMARGAKATPAADYLSVKDAQAVKSMLRSGQMDQLESAIQRQTAALMNDGAASRRY
jgi:twitching motility protein PilT